MFQGKPKKFPLTSPALLAVALARDVVTAVGVSGVAVAGVGTAQPEGVLVTLDLAVLAPPPSGARTPARH